MTVSVETPYSEHTANGVATTFAYEFRILEEAHLVVTVDGAAIGDSDYTVSGVDDEGGGDVTFAEAPVTGAAVVLSREIPYERTISYSTNGAFPAGTVNKDFDTLWMAIQGFVGSLGGSIRLPYPEQATELPASRLDKLLAFNATTGQPEVTSFTQTQMASALAAIYSAAAGPLDALSFLQAGTGAVSRGAQDKVRETRVSVKDFGAVGDGASHPLSGYFASLALAQAAYPHATSLTNEIDWAAAQAAINYLEAAGGGRALVPRGEYLIDQTLTFDEHGVTLEGEGGGVFFGTSTAQTVDSPVTMLKWTGGASEFVKFTSVAGSSIKSGGGLADLFLHCGTGAGVATYGIRITSWRAGTFRNVMIFNPTTWACKFECFPGLLSSPTSGYDNQHNHFEHVYHAIDSANTTGGGLLLTGGQGNGNTVDSNTAFNTFIQTRWQSASTVHCVFLQATDNNTFYGLRANGGGTELPVTVGALTLGCAEDDESGQGHPSRYNNFYGVEAAGGVLAKASQIGNGSSRENSIFGYNVSNGGDAPNIQAGAGGADDASLYVYGYRIYAPGGIYLPKDAELIFDARSAVLTDRTGTSSFSRLTVVDEGTLDGTVVGIQGSTSAGTGTYTVRGGTYTVIGRLVQFQMTIVWTAHTGTGNILINGLPFTALATSNRPCVLQVTTADITYSGSVRAHTQPNSKQLALKTAVSGGAIGDVAMASSGTIYVSGQYVREYV